MSNLRVLDLFSGIGGFSLGLERTNGFETKAFCEIDPYCRKVLAKHWPKVPCYEDVRSLTADTLARDGIAVDVICGGFPCQDISFAGAGAGIEGDRSGLWREYARLIGELRPRFIIVENVAALLGRGIGRVLGDLATLGYDALWDCIPASAVGAPHQRDRVWIVANPNGSGGPARQSAPKAMGYGHTAGSDGRSVADAAIDGRQPWWAGHPAQEPGRRQSGGGSVRKDLVANAECRRGQAVGECQAQGRTPAGPRGEGVSPSGDTDRGRWWAVEPDVGRVAHGVPARVDRLKGLGNAVVPEIPELIGQAILASIQQDQALAEVA